MTIGHLNSVDEINNWNQDNFHEIFLRKYWQKKPALIRNAFPNILKDIQLNKDDFLNFAQDNDIFTRTFQRKGESIEKRFGPFDKEEVESLQVCSNWTILVQEVDRFIPAVADLWHTGFFFIPTWRRDDIMISYSTAGGGIGGHVDNYDVFLIQGSGVREWAVENRFINENEEKMREIPNLSTRILSDFIPDAQWHLHPGDMLYLPPRIPHRGVSITNDCMTISVGFRSPNLQNVGTALWEDICTNDMNNDNSFYNDPDLPKLNSAASIYDSVRKDLFDGVMDKFNARAKSQNNYNRWLGKYLTTPLRYSRYSVQPFFFANSQPHLFESIEKSSNVASDIELNDCRVEDDGYDYDDDDEEEDEKALQYSVRNVKHRVASYKIFQNIDELWDSVMNGTVHLRRAEGLRVAHIESDLFIDGEIFEIPEPSKQTINRECYFEVIAKTLLHSNVLDTDAVRDVLGSNRQTPLFRFFSSLIRSGFFYPVDH